MESPEAISIQRTDWCEMLQHVQACLPREACGLLGGKDGSVRHVLPVKNVASGSSRFRMDPGSQIEAMLSLEEGGESIIGIYHSHPAGPSILSRTDMDEITYPEAANLIWSPFEDGWICRAFVLQVEHVHEIEIHIED